MSVPIDKSLDSIPSTWVCAKLGEIAVWASGGTPSSTVQQYYDGDIPWLVIGDLNDGYIYHSKRKISEAGLENSSAKIVAPNNVLVAMYGSIGKLGINKVPVATNQAIAFTQEISPYVLNKYLFYYLLCIRTELQSLGKGGAQKNISQSLLKEVNILLAPAKEQERIIAKIEELFSELDKGIEYLKTAQEQLKVYRQSVLKYAFEGKLSEKWREAHADQLETADRLLERIQQERKNRYQQQLNEWEEAVKVWEENGKEGKKPSKPKKPAEITSLAEEEMLQLPQLPESWCWVRVEALGEVQLGRQRSPQNRSRDYPTKYIRAANITEDGFDLTNVMDMEFKPHELERYQLKYGDILLSEASGSVDQAGKPALWRDQIPNCCFQNTVIRFQPICLSSEYMLNVFRHFYFNKIFSKVASGVGINHLSASKFSTLPVPLAPLAEQRHITQLIELNLSIHNQLETSINENLQKSTVLYNSILKKAFSGQLVPQDSRDESATVLLEKIRQSRRYNKENQELAPKPRKRTAMKKDLSIIEVLQELNGLATAQDVWQRSKYQADIEEFYAELKKQIKNGTVEEVEELREEKKSYLRLRNEN